MRSLYVILIMGITAMPITNYASNDGANIKLNINEIFSIVIAKTEKFLEISKEAEKSESIPKIASTYIHIGLRFHELATLILQSIPDEKRKLLCEYADTGTLSCLKFIEKPDSKFSGNFNGRLLRQKLNNLRYMYSSLKGQFENLSGELIVKDTVLFIEGGRNVVSRSMLLDKSDEALYDGTLEKHPIKALEIASRFETLGNRALILGPKFLGLIP